MTHSKKTCAMSLMEIAGKYMDKEEVSGFILDHQANVKRIQNSNRLLSLDKAEAQAVDEALTLLDRQVAETKRNAAYKLKQVITKTDWLLKSYDGSPIEGFNAMIGGSGGDIVAGLRGSKGLVGGSRDSIQSSITTRQNTVLNAFLAEMHENDTWEIFNGGKLDEEIYTELIELRDGGKIGKSGSDTAVKIAAIMESHQEYGRLGANDYGAGIEKRQGYAVSQSHDYYKLKPIGTETKSIAKKKWASAVKPLLNLDLTFKTDDMKSIDRYLSEVYDQLLSGVHLDFENPLSRFQGPGSMQKKISASRHLVFKDGSSAFKYNNMYGTGTLSETYTNGLRRLATNTVLIKELGVNPRDSLDQIFNNLKTVYSRREDADVIHSFREDAGTGMPKSSQNLVAVLLGDTQKVANHTAAKVGIVARGAESMSKLGQSLITSQVDVVQIVEEAAFQGRGLGAGIDDIITGFVTRTPEESRIASALGVVSEAMPGLMAERYGLDETLSGGMSKALQVYFNINGQRWWSDNLRAGHALGIAHYFGSHIADGSKFVDLPTETQYLLKAYNITDKEWNLYSKVKIENIRGRDYLAVEHLQNIPDEEFAKYLGIASETPGYEKNLRIGKEDVIGKLQNYVTDRANIAITQPDIHTKALLTQGTRPGTFEGEAMRAFGQFKSFPISMINASINKQIYAKGGGDNALDAIMKGNSNLTGLARTFIMMTAMGYVAMTTKDYLKGRNPRPMGMKTLTAAMLQGGAIGLYGDILFGESSKYGQDFTSSLLGPEAGLLNDVVQTIRADAASGDESSTVQSKLEGMRKTAIKRLDNHIPLMNLFYLKPFLDFTLLNQWQEDNNPGYMARMEQQLSNDNDGQTFWLRPSETVK